MPHNLSFSLLTRFVLTAILVFCLSSCGKQQATESSDTDPLPAENAAPQQAPQEQTANELVIVFEEPDPPEIPEAALEVSQTKTEMASSATKGKPRARVAIIIDDMGYHEQLGKKLLALDIALTYSFLPYAPHTIEHAQIAKDMDRDIMVHLPMEPMDAKWNPGKQALYVKDSDEQIREKTRQLLQQVPYATGANNHMGSRFTADETAMAVVLGELKQKNLFYIDSFTTAESQGLSVAGKIGVPTNRRHVFLDNVHDPEKVCRQLEKLVKLAQKKGTAIGIAHPNSATLNGLIQCKETVLASVDIVGAHQLVQ